jgi:argininosuccinate lyase
LAKELGFARVARNSLDVTSDRDPVAELLFACSLCMVHLSRWAEDLIIYSSPGFGYVELADAYSTGSSLMPQKKNPDSLELIRGRSGTLLGNLMSMLAVMKGLPLAYDRDLQEDKAAMFSGVGTTLGALEIAARVAALRMNWCSAAFLLPMRTNRWGSWFGIAPPRARHFRIYLLRRPRSSYRAGIPTCTTRLHPWSVPWPAAM